MSARLDWAEILRSRGVSAVVLSLAALACKSSPPEPTGQTTVREAIAKSRPEFTLRGTFVCTQCGRTELRTWLDKKLLSSELEHDGLDYVRRFAVELDPQHEHDWFLESGFSTEPGNICCTMVMIEGWYRGLPRLKDRAAADALFREAEGLPLEERTKLKDSFGLDVWIPYELDRTDLDRSFAAWLEQRRK